MTTYYAHSAQDKLGNLLPYEHWQTLQSHSVNVGKMAVGFARVFGAQEIACQTGQLHDLGKYSEPFDRRLHGGPSIDHATAGAKIAVERWGHVIGKLMAFCIAGHHAGLANGNGEGDNRRTLKQRLALQFGADISALDNLWQQEIKLPQNLPEPPLEPDAHHPFFSYAFFTRMLYSCLVDADYLDTEAFYSNLENKAVERGGYPDLNALQRNFNQFINDFRRRIAQAPDQTEAEKRNGLKPPAQRNSRLRRRTSGTTARAVHAYRADWWRQNLHFYGVRAGTRQTARYAARDLRHPIHQHHRTKRRRVSQSLWRIGRTSRVGTPQHFRRR